MQGLKTQESEKFNKFWNIVQRAASLEKSVFFLDCGEGREFETPDMEGEDLCGWLIPDDKVPEFEQAWKEDRVPDKWSDHLVWAKWKENKGSFSVNFKAN